MDLPLRCRRQAVPRLRTDAYHRLAEAREQARRCRQLLLEGVDPIAAGKAAGPPSLGGRQQQDLRRVRRRLARAHCASWTNRKHAREWKASLATHVLPEIGALPVAAIDTAEVLRVLQPAWIAIPETARGCAAASKRARLGQGPRLSRGREPGPMARPSRSSLPGRKKLARVKHHAALPYRELSRPHASGCACATSRGPRVGIRDPDGGAGRRGGRRRLERDRLRGSGVWTCRPNA